MKNSLKFALVVIMVLSLLVGCSSPAASSDPASASGSGAEASGTGEPKFTIVFTTSTAASETHAKVLHEVVAPELERLSGGDLKLEVYDSSMLFNQDDELPATIKGNADMTYTDSSYIATFMPSAGMFSAGYIFNDYDHMTEVMNGEIGQQLFEDIAAEVGVRPLFAYYMGSRTINLRSEEPVMTPEDLKGVKLRMPNSEAWLYLGKALGANPMPLAYSELYTALQTGAVDGQDNPLTGTEEGKFYEVTKSISLTNHTVGNTWPCINEELWQELGPEYQEMLVEAFRKGMEENDKRVLEKESTLVQQFTDMGLKVATPDIAAFKEHVLNYYLSDEDMIKDWDMELFEEIKAMGE